MNAMISDVKGFEFANGLLPLVNADTGEFAVNSEGFVKVQGKRGLQANSLLRKDEWEDLDDAIVSAQSERLNAVSRLRELGLVKNLGSIGTIVSQWNTSSQMTRATVNISGQAAPDMDRVDYNLSGIVVPVIHKSYTIGERQLVASRAFGEGIDITNAFNASRVVAEELERMFFNGYTGINLNGDTIYGVTNETNVNTGSADGDFGTISNIFPTFLNMVSDVQSDNYYGPYEVWVSTNQYVEMMNIYTDGSGQTAMQRVVSSIPELKAVHPGDYLTDGSLVMVTMTPNVIDLALYELGMNVEWSSGDGLTHNFKVMSIAAPRVKSDYDGDSGIVYYTGA